MFHHCPCLPPRNFGSHVSGLFSLKSPPRPQILPERSRISLFRPDLKPKRALWSYFTCLNIKSALSRYKSDSIGLNQPSKASYLTSQAFNRPCEALGLKSAFQSLPLSLYDLQSALLGPLRLQISPWKICIGPCRYLVISHLKSTLRLLINHFWPQISPLRL